MSAMMDATLMIALSVLALFVWSWLKEKRR